MAGLTKQECFRFLTDVLLVIIPAEIAHGRQKPDLHFLNEIIRKFMQEIPFQSVTLIAQDLAERHVPTWPEVKDAMFSRHGGVCHSLNGFMFFLLQGLGYDVTLGYGTVISLPKPEYADHILIFVRNLHSSDTYLVDVGFGCPSFEAVSLEFETESSVFRHSYQEYKFVKKGDKIFRCHGKGDPRFGRDPELWYTRFGDWIAVYEFKTEETRAFEEFAEFYKKTYTTLDGMAFQTSLRSVSFPHGKAMVILHNSTLIENEAGDLEKTKLPDDEALLACYLTNFPQFNKDLVQKAIRNWRRQQSGQE